MPETQVTATDNDNGANSAPIVMLIDTVVVNGQVVPDQTQASQIAGVDSRYQ